MLNINIVSRAALVVIGVLEETIGCMSLNAAIFSIKAYLMGDIIVGKAVVLLAQPREAMHFGTI